MLCELTNKIPYIFHQNCIFEYYDLNNFREKFGGQFVLTSAIEIATSSITVFKSYTKTMSDHIKTHIACDFDPIAISVNKRFEQIRIF